MKNILIAMTLAAIMIGCGSGATASSESTGSDASSGGAGVGGSMARFTISGDLLYTVNSRSLQAFDISIPSDPIIFTRTYSVPFDVETIFSYKDYLYLGAKTGLHVYSKPDNNGTDLVEVGVETHVRSYDPVVVSRDVAYVTLNSGRDNRGANELQIYDVSKETPRLISTQQRYLISPSGLGVDANKLFVCDGSEGLKIFDINQTENNETNLTSVKLNFDRASSISSIRCYDVIPHNNLLIVSNGSNVRQFDYSAFPMVEFNNTK